MRPLKESSESYFNELERRAKQTRAFTAYQLAGLEIAGLLNDQKHKALYIKLAKQHGASRLLQLAKSVAEKKHIKNLGAYFMKMLQNTRTDDNSNHSK